MLGLDLPTELAAGLSAAAGAIVGSLWTALKAERKGRAEDNAAAKKALEDDRSKWEALAKRYLPAPEDRQP